MDKLGLAILYLTVQDVADAYDRTAEEISALHLAIVPDNYVPF